MTPAAHPALAGISERRLLGLVAAVQFVNLLDFMLVMPLGPDFARDLGIPLSHLGWIGGSYTAAAAVVGVLAARFLDRFDRRSALAVVLLGLVIGTACGGLASGLDSLMLARVLAGSFGGPAAALSLSIVADVVPPERRGRALGIVMGSFAVASVVGLPAALELARLGGWRSTFFAVAGLGVIVAASALLLMPSLRLHLASPLPAAGPARRGLDRTSVLALLATFTTMMASFSIIPSISPYVQGNLHFPRENLGSLYFAGGSISFLAVLLTGRFADRFGASLLALIGSVLFVAIVASAFIAEQPLPSMLIYIGFMTSTGLRNVALSSLSTRVPLAHERARFLSLQSAVQHSAAALGAVCSAWLLHERPDHSLSGMPRVGALALGLALALPFLMQRIERTVRARESAAKIRNRAAQ